MTYPITFEKNASPEDIARIDEGIEAHTEELFPGKWRKGLTFFVRDDKGTVVGGVTGNYGSFGWLWVNTLWVRSDLRHGGYGTQLMAMIEAEAYSGGARQAFLNTMSFQAPEFYKRLGYTVFAELPDFPPGHSRIYFKKTLSKTLAM